MKVRKSTKTKHGLKLSEPGCCLSRNPKQSSLPRRVATRSSSGNQVECVDLTSETDSDYDSVGLDQTEQNDVVLKIAKNKTRYLKLTPDKIDVTGEDVEPVGPETEKEQSSL